MTLIQPNKQKKFFTKIAIAAFVPVVGGIFWLIILYNQNVNLTHNLDERKTELQSLEANNAELKEQFFALFTASNVEQFAKERGLIKEKNPRYFKVDEPWVFAVR